MDLNLYDMCTCEMPNPVKSDGWVIFGKILIAIGLFVLKITVLWLVWNLIIPPVFGGPVLEFWQSTLLVIGALLIIRW